MMVYSYKEDKDLDEWMAAYAGKHTGYITDQRKNFLQMKADFERYLSGKGQEAPPRRVTPSDTAAWS